MTGTWLLLLKIVPLNLTLLSLLIAIVVILIRNCIQWPIL